jgi:6-phosphofructokinase 1
MTGMRKIALMTSGGDAPGLNAAIRAVVRCAIYNRVDVVGIQRGYEGLMEGDFVEMDSSTVSNIIHKGGTILRSSRSKRFETVEGRAEAYRQLKRARADGLILLGGDGSFAGARVFLEEHELACVGIPKTIDNDIAGTDFTIGYDTAVNTAMRAIDNIRDTAESHNRLFLVEVMGRDAGFIALRTGLSVGAEAILVPESENDTARMMEVLAHGWNRKKSSMIVVVAEGDEEGGAYKIADKIKEQFSDYDMKVCILGHLQRGGSPTANDRILGSKLGAAAVEALLEGKTGVMVGEVNQEIVHTPFAKAVRVGMDRNSPMLRLMEMLAR